MLDEKAKVVRNERLKLTATLFNTCAAGVVVTGVLAQIAPVLYSGVVPHAPLWRLTALAGIVVACTLHLIARWIIGDLNP